MATAIRTVLLWACACALAVVLNAGLGPLALDKLDSWLVLRANFDAPSPAVAVVKVDNKSLDALQGSDLRILTLQKKTFASLLDKLYASGAKAVGIDVVFANVSSDAPSLAAALKRYPSAVIAVKSGVRDGEMILPLPVFSGATWGSIDTAYGPTTSLADRVVPFAGIPGGRTAEAFSLAVWRAYRGLPPAPSGKVIPGSGATDGAASMPGSSHYALDPLHALPLGDDGTFLLRFSGGPGAFPSYSLVDVLSGNVPAGAFSGKAVFVGEYGTLIHDAYFTPADPSVRMPGVELHAHAFSMLENGVTLASVPAAGVFLALALAALLAVLSGSFSGYRAALLAAVLVTVAAPPVARALAAMPEGWLLPVSAPILGAWSGLAVATAWRYFRTDRERRFVRDAFSRYLAPEVVRELADKPGSLKLGGEQRALTLLFSDLAGFTTMSEKLGTTEMFRVLSDYLTEMTDEVLRHRGTVDKYIGDAVMAFWGAPVASLTHARDAVQTALDMQSRMAGLNDRLAAQGAPALAVRIGVHTGTAVVGNVGSRERFSYTAIGDDVNLASRLEGVNKEYGTPILCSGETKKQAGDAFAWRELDRVRVKGKFQPVELWLPLGPVGTPDPAGPDYAAALALYRDGKFAEAKKAFSAISGDAPSQAMATRCADVLAGTAKAEGGVYVLEHK